MFGGFPTLHRKMAEVTVFNKRIVIISLITYSEVILKLPWNRICIPYDGICKNSSALPYLTSVFLVF